jgi:hypothetical protein
MLSTGLFHWFLKVKNAPYKITLPSAKAKFQIQFPNLYGIRLSLNKNERCFLN